MANGGWSTEKLTAHLQTIEVAQIYMTFAELEAVAGEFPESARKHPAYWANSLTSRPHSRAWLDAGFLASPEFVESRVRFQRGAPNAFHSWRPQRTTRPQKDAELPPTVAEPYRCELAYAWHDVGNVLITGGRLDIPNLGAGPGVYRFTLAEPSGEIRSYYVGESENLFRRMYGYNNPGPTQSTNLRMNRILHELLSSGGSVRIAVVFEATLDGVSLDLVRKPARLAVENTALLHLATQGAVVENLRTGP